MTDLFISDLHLYHQRPAVTEAFRQFLRQEAVQADSLYILGDLFEAWIGDDDPDPDNRSIVTSLKALTDSGTRCFFIRGNRDFLVGDRFAEETGVSILSDGTQIDLYNQPVLLFAWRYPVYGRQGISKIQTDCPPPGHTSRIPGTAGGGAPRPGKAHA